MTTRRMAYWWFRFVISGRFLQKFFSASTPVTSDQAPGGLNQMRPTGQGKVNASPGNYQD